MQFDVYEVSLSENPEETGVFQISIVDDPAIMVKGELFKNERLKKEGLQLLKQECQERIYKFIQLSDKKIIAAPVLIPDIYIYRREGEYEYYIKWSKEVIQECFNRFIKGDQNVNFMHLDISVNASFLEHWIVSDSENDKAISYGFKKEDLPIGTWFAILQIQDENFWNLIKEKNIKSFSVEACIYEKFVEKINFSALKSEKVSKEGFLSRFKELINTFLDSYRISKNLDTVIESEYQILPIKKPNFLSMETIILEDGTEVALDTNDGTCYKIVSGEISDVMPDGNFQIKGGGTLSVTGGKYTVSQKTEDTPPADSEQKTDTLEQKRLRFKIQNQEKLLKEVNQKLDELLKKPAEKPILEELKGSAVTSVNKYVKLPEMNQAQKNLQKIQSKWTELKQQRNNVLKNDLNQKNLKTLRQSLDNQLPTYPLIGQDIMGQIFAETTLISKGLVKVITGVRDTIKLANLDQTITWQERKCELTADVAGTETSLIPVELSVCHFAGLDKFCLDDFEAIFNQLGVWEAVQNGQFVEVQNIIMGQYMESVAALVAQDIENAYLNGDTSAYSGAVEGDPEYILSLCDGLITRLIAAGGSVANVSGATTINESNVIQALQDGFMLLQSTPALKNMYNSRYRNELYFLVSTEIEQYLLTAFTNLFGFYPNSQINGVTKDANNNFFFQGIPIYSSISMPASTYVLTFPENLLLGTDFEGNMNNIEMIPAYKYDGRKRYIQFRRTLALGAQFRRAEYIVLYNG